jgi:hypothetical protein
MSRRSCCGTWEQQPRGRLLLNEAPVALQSGDIFIRVVTRLGGYQAGLYRRPVAKLWDCEQKKLIRFEPRTYNIKLRMVYMILTLRPMVPANER